MNEVLSRGFLTIAFGPARYVEMAVGLCRSLKFHNPKACVALVTDRVRPRLPDLFDHVIPLDTRLGTGVEQKLQVDRYSPFDQTLFIDSDCLVFANPETLWDLYATANGLGVKGWAYLGPDDAHYGVQDMASLLRACGVSRMGALNTGLFYFDRSPAAASVFSTARALAARAAELGLKRFKTAAFADEPVFALALEKNGIPMMPWDGGTAMSTATAPDLQGLSAIQVHAGRRSLIRYATPTEPVVLHFHMQAQDAWPYHRELARLRLGPAHAWGALPALAALPSYLQARARYYLGRLKQKTRAFLPE